MEQTTHREDDPRVLVKDVREAMSEAAYIVTEYHDRIISGDSGGHLNHLMSELGQASMKLARLEAIL